MVLNEDEHAILARLIEEGQMVRKELRGGLGDEDVDLALDGIHGDGEVSRVGGENGDCRAGFKSIDGCFVGIGVALVVGWEGVEGHVEAIVDLGDVSLEMLACILLMRHSLSGLRYWYLRMPGNLEPETPTMLSFPTLPLRRRSKRDNPTTPTFLSEPEAAPPTKPVVYSPVPTCH